MNNEATISRQPYDHNNALVSIIIPAYNTAEYIHRAIESSLRQTHKNIEAIVVDDGSTDDTLNIAQEYAARDERVRVFTQENGGVSSARNHGIREARGEYMMFLDSDDWLEDDAAEILAAAQLEHPDMLIVCNFYDVHFVDNDSSRKDIFLRQKLYSNPSMKRTLAETLDAYMKSIYVTSCAKLFRTDIIRSYNLSFKEGIHQGEDQLFAFEYLIKMQGSFYVDSPLFDILSRPGSVSRTPLRQQRKNETDWVSFFVDNPEIPPDAREAATSYGASVFLLRYKYALDGRLDIETILSARQSTRKYLKSCLSSRVKSIPQKIHAVLISYLPIPLAKCVESIFSLIRNIRLYLYRRNMNTLTATREAVPYW